jgi:hypothetical protein
MGTWGGENSLTVPTDAAVGPAGSGSGLLPGGLEAGAGAGTRVVSPAATRGPVGSGSGLLPGGLEAGAGTCVVSPAAGGSLPRCINGNKYYVDK